MKVILIMAQVQPFKCLLVLKKQMAQLSYLAYKQLVVAAIMRKDRFLTGYCFFGPARNNFLLVISKFGRLGDRLLKLYHPDEIYAAADAKKGLSLVFIEACVGQVPKEKGIILALQSRGQLALQWVQTHYMADLCENRLHLPPLIFAFQNIFLSLGVAGSHSKKAIFSTVLIAELLEEFGSVGLHIMELFQLTPIERRILLVEDLLLAHACFFAILVRVSFWPLEKWGSWLTADQKHASLQRLTQQLILSNASAVSSFTQKTAKSAKTALKSLPCNCCAICFSASFSYITRQTSTNSDCILKVRKADWFQA